MTTPTAAAFIDRLRELATEEERVKYRRYFPGDDSFIGVRMGQVFDLAKQHLAMPVAELELLLESDIHEARAGACSIMGKAASAKRATEERRRELFELYLRRHDRIDEWDLVDLAAYHVVGPWLREHQDDTLDRLAASAFWPERRTAVLATMAWMRHGDTGETFRVAELLVDDPHDLVRKGVGWMLRTAGDLDREALRAFLSRHAGTMPRVMLRYAIEKLDKEERTRWLSTGRS